MANKRVHIIGWPWRNAKDSPQWHTTVHSPAWQKWTALTVEGMSVGGAGRYGEAPPGSPFNEVIVAPALRVLMVIMCSPSDAEAASHPRSRWLMDGRHRGLANLTQRGTVLLPLPLQVFDGSALQLSFFLCLVSFLPQRLIPVAVCIEVPAPWAVPEHVSQGGHLVTCTAEVLTHCLLLCKIVQALETTVYQRQAASIPGT